MPKLWEICSFLLIVSLLFHIFMNADFMGSLLIRRTFFVPAQLSFYYYDFFSNHQHLSLSHSILKTYFDYPYDLPPSHLIGKVYFDKPEMSANNGIVADAFMNFGIWGIIIWFFLLTVLLKLTDKVTYMKNKKVLWPIIIVSFYTMVNGAFFTTLLTHGLIIALLIAYFYPQNKPNTN